MIETNKQPVSILVTLEPQLVEAIDQQLSSMPLNKASRTNFVRQCVYDTLGYDQPHTMSHLPDRTQFSSIPTEHLKKDTRRVVELYCAGGNLSSICRDMAQGGWKTRRGGLWYHNTIRLMLAEALKTAGVLAKEA